jgi:agmatine deiminase
MTTTPCLLGPTRNPDRTHAEIEHALALALGVKRWIWLDYGLEGDHTDGHIDTLARFVSQGRALAASCSADDANHAGLQRNRRLLQEAGVEVIDLPIPAQARYLEGVRLPETYANYYLANGIVVVPQYGDAKDQAALEIIGSCFPERRVVGLSSRVIISGGGSFHCLSQQQPAGQICSSP